MRGGGFIDEIVPSLEASYRLFGTTRTVGLVSGCTRGTGHPIGASWDSEVTSVLPPRVDRQSVRCSPSELVFRSLGHSVLSNVTQSCANTRPFTPSGYVPELMSATASPPFPRAPPGASAEKQATAFGDDPRVSFDTQIARWRLEDGDAEYEYEPSKAVWIPVVSLPLPPRDN